MNRTLWRGALLSLSAGVLLHAAAAITWEPACDETRTGMYTFEKLGGSKEQPVRISVCPDVACATHTEFATVNQDAYSAAAPKDMARPFFLVERHGEKRIIGARRLALQGAYNFRDLGGLRTADGKTIRWGKVFRSDTLTMLTPSDYARLNAIGISLVCDLRTRDERKADPTEWQNGSPMYLLAPVSENSKGASQNGSVNGILSANVSVEEGRKMFEKFYINMIFDAAPKFGAVLRAIETSDQPAMFHCTGGRDRTGITAALLEHILGVPNETIYADFVLSTKYLSENPKPHGMPAVDPKQAAMFAQVIELQPRYIQAIFKAIDEKYGSFDRYRREALHFSDADVTMLKARLLE